MEWGTKAWQGLAEKFLVAAGVGLAGDEDEVWPGRFRPGGGAEGRKNSDHGNVRGKNAEANGCENGEAKNERHKERNHGPVTLQGFSLAKLALIRCTAQKSVYLLCLPSFGAKSTYLPHCTCVDAPRY